MFYNVATKKTEELKDIISKTRPQDPAFVAAVPHGGLYIPVSCLPHLDFTRPTFSSTLDWCTQELYALSSIGGVVVQTQIHRYIVDANRERTDAGTEGVIREIGFDGKPNFRIPYSREEREALLQQWYDPFAQMIREEMDALKAKYGKVFLLNGHSMSKQAPVTRQRQEQGPRPGFCIGTRNGTSAEEKIIQTFAETLHKYAKPLGAEVMLDYPYEGNVGLSMEYGKPDKGYNCLLLEINDGLYYDEHTGKAHKGRVQLIHEIILWTMQDVVPLLK